MKLLTLITFALVLGFACTLVKKHETAVIPAEFKGLTFAAMGDTPYFQKAWNKFRKIKQPVSDANPIFMAHVGDIKDGGSTCTDKSIRDVYDFLDSFPVPVVFTPGDNEWVDCHRSATPPNKPQERLEFIRNLFYSDGHSLGQRKIKYTSQSEKFKKNKKFVENNYFIQSHVLFATVHVVGSNNNLTPEIPGAKAEFEERNQANLAWLKHIFKKAHKENTEAVVIFQHGDPMFTYKPEERTGFNEYINALIKRVDHYKKPVLLVHGDWHRFIFDQPLRYGKEHMGFNTSLANFYRLEVFGADDVGVIFVTIDTKQAVPFSVFPLLIQ